MSIGSIEKQTRSSGAEATLFLYEVSQRALVELAPFATKAVKSAHLLNGPVTEDTFARVVAHALTLPSQGPVLPVAGLDRQTILTRLGDIDDTGFLEVFVELTIFGPIQWTQQPAQSLIAYRTYASGGSEAAVIFMLRGASDERHVLDLGPPEWAKAKAYFLGRSTPPKDDLAELRALLNVQWMGRADLKNRLIDFPFAEAYVSATATRDPRWPPLI